jgi:hypothetical protein
MDNMGKLLREDTRRQAQLKPKTDMRANTNSTAQLSAMRNVGGILADTNIKLLKGSVNQLKGNAIYRKLDSLLSGSNMGEKPLTKVLNAIAARKFHVLEATLPQIMDGYSSPEYRSESPVLYALSDLIFPTINDMVNIGINSGLSDEGEIDNQNGTFGYENFDNIAAGIIETLTGLVKAKEVVSLVRKTDITEPAKIEKLADFYEKVDEETGDNFTDAQDFDQADSEVSEVMTAYMTRTNRTADNNAGHYTDMLSSAKSTVKNSGTRYYQKSVAKVGQGYVGIGFGVYGAMEKIGNSSRAGDWRTELKAVLDPHAIPYHAITKKPVEGIDSEQKFASLSGGAWSKAEGKLKEVMNGTD